MGRFSYGGAKTCNLLPGSSVFLLSKCISSIVFCMLYKENLLCGYVYPLGAEWCFLQVLFWCSKQILKLVFFFL